MRIHRFSTLLVLRRNFALTCASLRSSDNRRVRHATDLAFPPHFEAKIRNWNKLVELELKARAGNDQDDSLLACFSRIQLVKLKRDVRGTTAEVKVPEMTCEDEGKIARALSLLKSGIPVKITRLVPADPTNDDSPDAPSVPSSAPEHSFKAVIMHMPDEALAVKIVGARETDALRILKNADSDMFKLTAESEYGFYQMLKSLLSNRKVWPEYPGHKLLLYTYRARQMPPAFADRPIFLSKEYNEDQCAAVAAAVNTQRPLTAIQGPPGTGKTKVIGEIIAESIRRKQKVLVCAPSHKAVNNIMEVCKRKGLQKHCKIHGETASNDRYLTTLIKHHSYYPMLEKCYNDYNKADGVLNDSADSQVIRKKLLARTNSMERQIQMDIATDTRILLCTLSSCSVNQMMEKGFEPDLTIIDEAGQAMEVETWPMLFQAPRAVVVGDHNQLSPIVCSVKAKEENLGVSLIEHLSKEFGKNINFALRTQYRSNSLIQRWSSTEFYSGLLNAHHSCAKIHLRDLLDKAKEPNFDSPPTPSNFASRESSAVIAYAPIDDPLVLVDTDLVESDVELLTKNQLFPIEKAQKFDATIFREKMFTHSAFNKGEARICARHLEALVLHGRLEPRMVGCITPYTAQTKEILRQLHADLREKIDISSVDSFQGQEREVIVMSFVRNNRSENIGFLDEVRRMNVAITRAKRQFFIVASGRMMRVNRVIARLYETIVDEGRVVSPAEVLFPSAIRQARLKEQSLPTTVEKAVLGKTRRNFV